MQTEFWSNTLKGRYYMRGPGVDWKIILKLCLKILHGGYGLDSSAQDSDSDVLLWKQSNELFCFLKTRGIVWPAEWVSSHEHLCSIEWIRVSVLQPFDMMAKKKKNNIVRSLVSRIEPLPLIFQPLMREVHRNKALYNTCELLEGVGAFSGCSLVNSALFCPYLFSCHSHR
jgi:hypothetical protein